ncbi:MAG: hypothetical protein ACRDHZ_03255, partial [Ktedonobacteraceae bacterium]
DSTTPTWGEWEPYLIENARYDMAYFDGLNRFYVRREYADLRCHFETPPNVFDYFKHHSMQIAEKERDALQQERDRLAARVAELEAEKSCLAQQAARSHELEEALFNTRLWVGRLAQDLAASRQPR